MSFGEAQTQYPFIQSISTVLMEAEARRLNKTVIDLNNENKKLNESTTDGFMYNGQYYQPRGVDLTLANRYEPRTPLHKSLWERMEFYLKDRAQCKSDMVQIDQVLYLLLKPNDRVLTRGEVRDALPECIVSLMPDLMALPRGYEEAYTLRNNPRAMKQYLRVLPKMELYSMTRLMY